MALLFSSVVPLQLSLILRLHLLQQHVSGVLILSAILHSSGDDYFSQIAFNEHSQFAKTSKT